MPSETPMNSSSFFARFPSDIVRLIAKETSYSTYCADLCRVNKFCNAECTSVLYGMKIVIDSQPKLDSLYETLFDHKPELRASVKELEILHPIILEWDSSHT